MEIFEGVNDAYQVMVHSLFLITVPAVHGLVGAVARVLPSSGTRSLLKQNHYLIIDKKQSSDVDAVGYTLFGS